MEKNYTACRPAICLHAVIFWDFLSCGEACKSSRKFKKSKKMVTSANCGAGGEKCGADSKDLLLFFTKKEHLSPFKHTCRGPGGTRRIIRGAGNDI